MKPRLYCIILTKVIFSLKTTKTVVASPIVIIKESENDVQLFIEKSIATSPLYSIHSFALSLLLIGKKLF